MIKALYIYDDILSRHVLRADHPLRPTRLRLTYELLDAFGVFRQPEALLVPPRPATEQELLLCHTQDFIQAVQSFNSGDARGSPYDPLRYGFNPSGDNPIYEGIYEASILPVGSSLIAAKAVADGEVPVAFSSSGGLHHAMPDRASGFCVFNDVAIAIKYLTSRGLRVAYVDIDAHHGDGVQHAFYDTSQVLTISLHESGQFLFPGTGSVEEMGTGAGKGYAVNLPLLPSTDDEVYLWAFRGVVPPLVRAFRPDVLVAQLGVDSYFQDPLTHLGLTTRGFVQAVQELSRLAPRWVAVGGGGYDLSAVARCWTLAYGVMLGLELPNRIPDGFREKYGIALLRDDQSPAIEPGHKEACWRFAQQSVARVKQLIFPLHGL